jgi:Flp pilus assembly protein protease CpaA|tara:strand:- start:116 stop:283 length:168 start_codon:yes stop_codon:yes gene_type:complete
VLKKLNKAFVYVAYAAIGVNIFLLFHSRLIGNADGQILAVLNLFLLAFVAFKDTK